MTTDREALRAIAAIKPDFPTYVETNNERLRTAVRIAREAIEFLPLHPRAEWEWFGNAGHLVVGRDCRFHMATRVGPWWVSTVGEYLPGEGSWDIFARRAGGIPRELRGDDREAWFLKNVGYIEIGSGRKYETMVFPVEKDRCDEEGCKCEGCPRVATWSEFDSDAYNDSRSARDGHMAMCEKWSWRAVGSRPDWDDDDG